jgi:hypothetical protein
MYCHACGIALSQPTKYCNRCGVQLITQDPSGEVKRTEKRLDEYLDGLFWITVFGLGLILGGMIVLKQVGFSDLFILAYLLISSTAFIINFVINLMAARRIGRKSRDLPGNDERQTGQLGPGTPDVLPPATSVTEHTTRSFEPACAKRKTEEG